MQANQVSAGKIATAGAAACFADVLTFPFDVVKVRLQVQSGAFQRGLLATTHAMIRREGVGSLFRGIVPGLHRQACFSSIRIGLYDDFKRHYIRLFGDIGMRSDGGIGLRVLAGATTGGLAVLFAQPTDVVKVRMQAGDKQYSSVFDAYRSIRRSEGLQNGLWRGTVPNMTRNGIVNVCEVVCYDVTKDALIRRRVFDDTLACQVSAATTSGLVTTLIASPVDVVKTRYMNAKSREYKNILSCAYKVYEHGGLVAFYKGFIPSFLRISCWNIIMFVSYEQLKKHLL